MNADETRNKTQGKTEVIGLEHTCGISIDFWGLHIVIL